MSSLCEIRIYDRNFNWVNVVGLAESVQLTRELYGVGGFEIHVQPDKIGVTDLIKRGNIIVINGDGEKSGIVGDFGLSESREGAEVVVYGDTADGLTKQRIVVPPTQAQDASALGWDKIEAAAETVIKHYAGRNMTTAFDSQRNIGNLVIAPDKRRGKTFPWKARYSNLSEELQNICEYAEMGYSVSADLAGRCWNLEIIEGADRSTAQKELSPVTFRVENHSVDNYEYTEDFQNYKSTGYAGGKGDDEKRLIYTLGTENTGLDRWETFLDCGSAENITELIYYGEQKMNEHKEARTLEVMTLPRAFQYNRDYFLGDIVTVYLSRLGLTAHTRITSVKEIWERESGYKTEIRLGAKIPNLVTLLQKREVVR